MEERLTGSKEGDGAGLCLPAPGFARESPGSNDLHPSWSPDGSTIAWTKYSGDNNRSVYVVGANGTGLLRVADQGDGPAWSPGGGLIAFNGVNVQGDKQFAEVLVVSPDGTGLRMLVSPEDPRGSHVDSHVPWRIVQ
jgi:Tol biopolymer transport system component